MTHFNKTLIKDHDLPIMFYHEPYFSHFVQLYSPFFKIEELASLLRQDIALVGEEAAAQAHFKVAEQLIAKMKATPAYQEFSQSSMDKYALTTKGAGKVNLYNREHQGLHLSIDIQQANFNVLRLHNPHLFGEALTYADWFKTVSSSEYLLRSKRLRQIVFGNLAPQRQQTMQKYYITQVWQVIFPLLTAHKIHAASADELVFAVTADWPELVAKLQAAISANPVTAAIAPFLRYDVFNLKAIHPQQPYYVKEYVNPAGKVEFRNIPQNYLAEMVRHYRGLPPEELDRHFTIDGRVAQFTDSLFK